MFSEDNKSEGFGGSGPDVKTSKKGTKLSFKAFSKVVSLLINIDKPTLFFSLNILFIVGLYISASISRTFDFAAARVKAIFAATKDLLSKDDGDDIATTLLFVLAVREKIRFNLKL